MQQCPVCYTALEVRECAPCHDCGAEPSELDDLRNGEHTYSVYEVYNGLRLTLCDFCDVDFGSYYPEYLGFKDGRRIGYGEFEFVRTIDRPEIEKDKYCTECRRRLKFLEFLVAIREMNR